MTYRRETWNRFLRTILERIPPLIINYSQSDQDLINSVFEILSQGNVSTQEDREKFLTSMDKFVKENINSIEYFQAPFLWFSSTFFLNAQRLLIEARFHADDFIQYLVKVLRGDSHNQGFFQLLQNKIPLQDLKWESLQYYCNEIYDPLTKTQIEILRIIYSMVKTDPLRAMDQHFITREIAQNIQVTKQFRGLHHLFSRLDARWGVWMFSEAFGLSMLQFNIILSDTQSLEDTIDFLSPESVVLQMSNIYNNPNNPESYFGFLYVPNDTASQLIAYLEDQRNTGHFAELQINPVLTNQAGSSLALYVPESGWENTYIPIDIRDSIESRRTIKPKEIVSYLGYVTPQLSNNLDYKVLESPEQAIQLYIKSSNAFSFGNLPIKRGEDYHNSIFSQSDLALLAKFFSKNIAGPTFTVRNILNEYSLDMYWIEIPAKWECTAFTFLHLLPWSSVLTTIDKTILIAPLSSNILRWIKTSLEWNISPIHSVFRSRSLTEEWYNFQEEVWNPPRFLGG